MRTLRKNQQKLKYSSQIAEVPTYLTDENGDIEYEHYEDSDGNKIYYFDDNGNRIPLETGEKEMIYSTPQEFFGNIAMSGGEAEAVEYGLSTADYEAVIVLEKRYVSLKEGDLIWHESKVKYKYGNEEEDAEILVNGEMIKGKFPEKMSADYQVMRVSDSLNFTKILLEAINK